MGILRVIKGIYNLVMGLIGLAVVGVVVYVFFLNQKAEYEEEQYAEERRELAGEIEASLKGDGIDDPDALKAAYLEQCPIDEYRIVDGDEAAICEAYADALLARSVDRGLSLEGFGELGFQLCAKEYVDEGYDPEEYCDRDYSMAEAKSDAIKVAMCAFDTAHIYDIDYGEYITKRGDSVYYYYEEYVDCTAGHVLVYDEERFFETYYNEDDEDWPRIIDRLYEALDERGTDAAIAILDGHDFGDDPELDRWILSEFLYDDYVDFVAAVLERNGGQVSFEDDYYRQPLSMAISNESPAVAMMLLEAGASPTHPWTDGNPPIVDAASYGLLDVVRELVARGADVDGIKGSDAMDFGAPLAWAAYSGHSDVAYWLLKEGASVAPANPDDYPNWDEGRLIEYAAESGNLAIFGAVIEKGAATSDSIELFGSAIMGGNADVLAMVFELGYGMPEDDMHESLYEMVVSVVKEDDEEKYRTEQGVRMFELLLDKGLKIVIDSDDDWARGLQAVTYYAPNPVMTGSDERGNFVREQRITFVKRVIDEVLAAGIDIDAANNSGETMLMAAADGGQAEIASYLLQQGADPKLTNEDGITALELAVNEGRRLGSIWKDDKPVVHDRFANTVVALGGSADLLEPEATAAND